DPVLVPTLIDLMNDPEPEVRQMAAFALGLIGDKGAVERLVASLGDSEAVVRARCAEALGRIGEPRAAADLARFVLNAIPKGAPLLTVRGDDPGSARDPWWRPPRCGPWPRPQTRGPRRPPPRSSPRPTRWSSARRCGPWPPSPRTAACVASSSPWSETRTRGSGRPPCPLSRGPTART